MNFETMLPDEQLLSEEQQGTSFASLCVTVHSVPIKLCGNAFLGLSRQNLDFPHSLYEITDNNIAATPPGEKTIVRIHLMRHPSESEKILVTISDWGRGMNLTDLERALQLGAPPVSDSRLNEHGFGLKNALSVLSGGNGPWTLATRKRGTSLWFVTHGPFAPTMQVEERTDLTGVLFEGTPDWGDASTIIQVATPLAYARTVQTRGGALSDCATLRSWLLEHLGVTYHTLLEQDPRTMEPRLKISIRVGDSTVLVPPVRVPMDVIAQVPIQMELGGRLVTMVYRYGSLNADRRDHLICTSEGISRAKCYYQGNIPTQGIQIEVGGRVLATGLLSEIWRQDRNGDPVARHNHYNDFVGELVIPDLPRGVLATLNNKTSLDPQDPDWQAVFEKLSAYPPPKSATGDSEAVLKAKWMDILQAACPQDRVSDEQSVWSTGTRIDVVAENTGKLDIYELKTRKAEPLNLYQLKMYWDGLVVDKGKQPTSATLLAADYSSEILNMLNQMNALPPPCFADGAPSAPYNLKIATLAEKKLQ